MKTVFRAVIITVQSLTAKPNKAKRHFNGDAETTKRFGF